jgi:PAS domain S-box-containing protein
MAIFAIADRDCTRVLASIGAATAQADAVAADLFAKTVKRNDVYVTDDAGVAGVGAYAGVQLYARDGSIAGILAVADHRPGTFSSDQIAALRDFGCISSALIGSSREVALSRLMARAIEEALDFVLLTDASLPSQGGPYIEYANASLLHALGYTSDELIGKPYSILFSPSNDPATVASIAANVECARDNEKEIRMRRKDGSTFWVEFTGRPLLDENAAPSHWIAVGRDITKNRDALRQTAALLKALDSVTDGVEIYTLENGSYELAFQNAAANAQISSAFEAMLSDASVRQRLAGGECIVNGQGGIVLRPLGHDADTIICLHRNPAHLAAVS